MTADTRFYVKHRFTRSTIMLVTAFTLSLGACDQIESKEAWNSHQSEPTQKNRQKPHPESDPGRRKADAAELQQLAEHYIRTLGQASERYRMYVRRVRELSAACGEGEGLKLQRLKERGFGGLMDEGMRTCEERTAQFDRATRRYAKNLLKAADQLQYLLSLIRKNGRSSDFKDLGVRRAHDPALLHQSIGS